MTRAEIWQKLLSGTHPMELFKGQSHDAFILFFADEVVDLKREFEALKSTKFYPSFGKYVVRGEVNYSDGHKTDFEQEIEMKVVNLQIEKLKKQLDIAVRCLEKINYDQLKICKGSNVTSVSFIDSEKALNEIQAIEEIEGE